MADTRRCHSCGYALDGLDDGPADRPCPECGVPINTGLATLDRLWLGATVLSAIALGQWLLTNILVTMIGVDGVSMPTWMRVVPAMGFGLAGLALWMLLTKRLPYRLQPPGMRWLVLVGTALLVGGQYGLLAVLVVLR